MAKLEGNLMFSSEKGKQLNERSNLRTKRVLEVFHLSCCRWFTLKERKRKLAGVPMLRAMAMWKHSQPHLAFANDASGFQYFPFLVLKNGSAFEKCISFSATALLFLFAVHLLDVR